VPMYYKLCIVSSDFVVPLVPLNYRLCVTGWIYQNPPLHLYWHHSSPWTPVPAHRRVWRHHGFRCISSGLLIFMKS
jgi:hypothetical protein